MPNRSLLSARYLLLGLVLLTIPLCLSQPAPDLCKVTKSSAGNDAYAALYRIIDRVGINPGSIFLYESTDPFLASSGGSAASWCNTTAATEKWIVYSPNMLRGKGEMSRYFVLAHELAHHTRDHTDPALTGPSRAEMEAEADYWAAVYLSRLGYSDQQILQGFDALAFPIGATKEYPSRADRRAQVLQGYAFDRGGTQSSSSVTSIQTQSPLPPQAAPPSKSIVFGYRFAIRYNPDSWFTSDLNLGPSNDRLQFALVNSKLAAILIGDSIQKTTNSLFTESINDLGGLTQVQIDERPSLMSSPKGFYRYVLAKGANRYRYYTFSGEQGTLRAVAYGPANDPDWARADEFLHGIELLSQPIR